ncbi:MAG: phage tail tube protein [Methylovirgula sp.]|nr:phage tail tube protein [Methylovirgula sp.]
MSALAGTITVTIDGVPYAISGTCNYLVSSTERETLKGQDGVHGFKEMPKEGWISFHGRDSGAVSMKKLNAVDNSTVVAALANGKVIIGNGMWRDGDPAEVNTEDGSFDIKFASGDVTEN